MGCGSSSEVRAITPESRPHYNNNDNSNKQRHQQHQQQQHQQQQQVQQHPNSVENDHELREQQEQQAMLLKQQQEEQQQAMLLKQQEEQAMMMKQQEEQQAMLLKQQEEQQQAMLLKQQEEQQQAMLLKHQEEEQKAILQQQQEAALLMHQQQAQQNQEQDNNPNNPAETQPDSDSLGEGSAPEETLEQARQRLAVYGQYDEGYTVKQVSAINQEKGQSVLFIWAKIVHLTAAFKDIIEPEVAARQAELEQDCPGLFEEDMLLHLREKSNTHPVMTVNRIGIKMSTILKYVSKCKVATLVILNNKEFWSDIRSDADRLAMDIKSDGNVSPYLTEYLEVLVRFFELFARLDGDIPLSPSKSDGDPNMLSFPLPNSVAADPESIRRWAEAWEVFDFVVPEDGAWGWYGFENLVFTDINECVDFPQLLRGDEELLEFDTKVEGEAAWDVIEVDLFKDDVTTEEQDLIWEEREKRSDFDSPERMKKRREKIEQYFIIKYEWESSALDAYRGWTDALEAGWQNFQKLCES